MKKILKNQLSCFYIGFICLTMFLVISQKGLSQNIGISPAGISTPNSAAGLDINFSDKGLLIPRIDLESTSSFAPLLAHVAGMIVYNKATISDVIPGYYYNNGTNWLPFYTRANNSGDIQYWSGTEWVIIPVGQLGQTLQINGSGIPVWVSGILSSLNTKGLSAITSNTASSGGIVLNDGGSNVSSYGVCWSTSSSPTILNNFTNDGSGIGSFTSNITGLVTGTIYFLRAYAITASGVSYGNELSFITP